ncbi:MAG: outer membrane lipoprotein carrier protein LolA [Ginsengibacter sp.]
MIKKILLALLCFSFLHSFSQSSAIGKSDPDAKKILDNVSSKFKSFKSVVARFSLKIENAAGKVQGTKSGVLNMKGSKYRISVSGQDIYSDGSNIWTYDKAANEVQVTKFDASANMITPQKLFTNFYDKDFLYKLNDESKTGKQVIQEIELTPVDKTKAFFKVLLGVDKTNKSIVSTRVFEKNGNKYTYDVTGMKTNTNLPDALFVFDAKKYPGVEIVDLR